MSLRKGLLAALAALASLAALAPAGSLAAPPNIVVVVVDGLGELATPLGGPNEVLPDPEIRARLTPNLDRLAKLGATFTCAQAVDTREPPVGMTLELEGTSLPALLKAAGYATAATGVSEVAAHEWGTFRPYSQNAEQPHRTRFYPERKQAGGGLPSVSWRVLTPTDDRKKEDLSIEAWEKLTESLDEQLAAAWAADQIGATKRSAPPQFVYVGLPGPAAANQPWTVPGVFSERFPLEEITLPELPPSDETANDHEGIGIRAKLFSAEDSPAIYQAYLAAASATDYALGKVIDAVEAANSDDDKTNDWALVVVSKRGYQLGQRGVWAYSPWEPAAHANLMIVAPGISTPEQTIDTPVSVEGVAPTLAALAGVASGAGDLSPLLTTKGGWPGAVALTTVGDAASSLRSQRFRLVRFADGAEELYDHDHDAHEAHDLLDPNKTIDLKLFRLSETQVEAVREWLAKRLDEQLAQRDAPGAKPAPVDFLPGDFNDDGSVDAADSTLWRDNLGKEVAVGTAGDGDFDGRVEEDDRNVWLNNYGRKREPAAAE